MHERAVEIDPGGEHARELNDMGDRSGALSGSLILELERAVGLFGADGLNSPLKKSFGREFGPFRPESSASKLGNQAGCLRFDADDLNENDSNLGSKHFFNRLLEPPGEAQNRLHLVPLRPVVRSLVVGLEHRGLHGKVLRDREYQ